MSKQVGYIRVSSMDQNTQRQLDGVTLDKVFTDHASGKDINRPALVACLDYLREGDTLLAHSMDRLARNLENLRSIVRQLTSKGIQVRFVKESMTFTGEDSPMNTLMLSLLGAVSEFERMMIRERQREGIAIAKTKGIYKGRKAKLSAAQIATLKDRVAAGGVVKAQLARELGISRETLYSYLNAKDGLLA